MNKLEELGCNILKRQIQEPNEFLGITREGNLLIAWYNDEKGSTKCLTQEIPYYDSYENIQQAKQVLGRG